MKNAGGFSVGDLPPALDVETPDGQPSQTVRSAVAKWLDDAAGHAHHLDIAQWGLGRDGDGPVAVEAEGEKPSTDKHAYNCHPTFKVTYTYADGVKVIASDTTLPDTKGEKDTNGILFNGEGGKWIFVSRGKISASDPKLLTEPLASDATRLEVSTNHMANFLNCTQTRKKPICHVGVGAGSVIRGSHVTHAVIGQKTAIVDSTLTQSMLGDHAVVEGVRGSASIGDHGEVRSA